jgi:hypothetical protein
MDVAKPSPFIGGQFFSCCASFYLPSVSQKLTSSYISNFKFSETHARHTWRSPAMARPRNRFQIGAAEQAHCRRSVGQTAGNLRRIWCLLDGSWALDPLNAFAVAGPVMNAHDRFSSRARNLNASKTRHGLPWSSGAFECVPRGLIGTVKNRARLLTEMPIDAGLLESTSDRGRGSEAYAGAALGQRDLSPAPRPPRGGAGQD